MWVNLFAQPPLGTPSICQQLSQRLASTNQPLCSMLQTQHTTFEPRMSKSCQGNRAGTKEGLERAFSSAASHPPLIVMTEDTYYPTATTLSSTNSPKNLRHLRLTKVWSLSSAQPKGHRAAPESPLLPASKKQLWPKLYLCPLTLCPLATDRPDQSRIRGQPDHPWSVFFFPFSVFALLYHPPHPLLYLCTSCHIAWWRVLE